MRQLTALDTLFLAAEITAPKGGMAMTAGRPVKRAPTGGSCHFTPALTPCSIDRFEFVALIPGTATGRIKKTALRGQFTLA